MNKTINPPIRTERLIVRALEDGDLPLMLDIIKEDSIIYEMFNGEYSDKVCSSYWKQITAANVINGMIFLQKSREFCGRVCVTFEDPRAPELGIQLLEPVRNRGIGPEAIIAFSDWLYQTFHIGRLKVRIEPDNKHSIHIFEKLGAVFLDKHCLFSEDTLQAVRKFNLDTSGMEQQSVLEYYLRLPLQT